jgi:hypothetical protein
MVKKPQIKLTKHEQRILLDAITKGITEPNWEKKVKARIEKLINEAAERLAKKGIKVKD